MRSGIRFERLHEALSDSKTPPLCRYANPNQGHRGQWQLRELAGRRRIAKKALKSFAQLAQKPEIKKDPWMGDHAMGSDDQEIPV